MNVQSYLEGKWVFGKGSGKPLFNAINGDVVGEVSTEGFSWEGVLDYGRTIGSPALRKLTFHDRARMLKALALHLNGKKDDFYKISWATGATKIDGWIDIEGGIGNLFSYSSKGRRELPNESFYVDGATEMLSASGNFQAQHICVPLEGVAIHINAFNFPVWGMLEKIAVNLLAGMPSVVKPATLTCYLTEAVVKEIIASKILPEGALQLISGSANNILDYVNSQDVVTFTGSASTGKMLKSHHNIVDQAVRFTMEADSLNFSCLGPDATPGTEDYDIFIKEVAKEMTVKAGQKCTAIRRIMVPENLVEDVQKALLARLDKVVVGDPQQEGVRMGALAGRTQVREVSERIDELTRCCELIRDGRADFALTGGDREKGAFLAPTLLRCNHPMESEVVHSVEAFGPVSTIIPYKEAEQVVALAKKGKGSLVGSIITNDQNFARDVVLGTASHHGRILVLNKSCAKESTGHGSPLPQLVHGGPGRAGGGEEMGGVRGVLHYMQRTAIQGHPTTLTKVSNRYVKGGEQIVDSIHPFRKMFDDLTVGETLVTKKRKITLEDVEAFAHLSGDKFYAHMDETALEGSIFEERCAHGYFILSAAAGLFVDPEKGPVIANYGLDEARFIRPVYFGTTIGVRLTVKEKIPQDKRPDDDVAKGIVKWLVDVYDDEGETVALATILTLVARKE